MPDLIANVSTLQASLTRQRSIARLTTEMNQAETEVSTGMRADIFRDLGERATESVVLRSRIDRTENFLTSNELLSGRLEVTALGLSGIRSAAEDFLALAVGNRDAPGGTVQELKSSARSAIEQIVSQANQRFQGVSVFAGIDSDADTLQAWGSENAGTGLSPRDVLAGIVGQGPADATEAQAMVDEIAAVFDGTHADPGRRFGSTFYNGTPAQLPDGSTPARVEARIDEGVTLNYGIQANDAPIRKVLQGLSMIAAVDPALIEDEGAYSTYMSAAVDALSSGANGLIDTTGRLGNQQAMLERTMTAQEDRVSVYESRVLALESVDPYEAASRVSTLQSQLQASYAVTSRLANLSILNFMV